MQRRPGYQTLIQRTRRRKVLDGTHARRSSMRLSGGREKTDAARIQVMNRNVDNSARAALSKFLINSEIPVRQLAELAIANATSVRSFCSGEHKELVIIADLLLECARKIVECWIIASGREAFAQEL